MSFIKSVLVIATISLISCDHKDLDPYIYFDKSFPKAEKDLRKVLGENLILKREDDTLFLSIQYDKVTNRNFILETSTKDTVLICRAFKYRNLYYLTEEKGDTLFAIHAMKVKGNIVQGLNTRFFQMYSLRQKIEEGKYSSLVKQRDSSSNIILRFEKKQLTDFYKSVVDSLPVYTILNYKKGENEALRKDTLFAQIKDSVITTDEDITATIYPNPAKEVLHIKFDEGNDYNFTVQNNLGLQVAHGEGKGELYKLDVSDLKSGFYYLTIVNSKTGDKLVARFLVED